MATRHYGTTTVSAVGWSAATDELALSQTPPGAGSISEEVRKNDTETVLALTSGSGVPGWVAWDDSGSISLDLSAFPAGLALDSSPSALNAVASDAATVTTSVTLAAWSSTTGTGIKTRAYSTGTFAGEGTGSRLGWEFSVTNSDTKNNLTATVDFSSDDTWADITQGAVTHTGTGDLTLGPPSVSGSGAMHPSATGALVLPSPPAISGTGTHTGDEAPATIAARTNGGLAESTTYTYTYPSGTVDGSLLTLHVSYDGGDTPSTPTGWTLGGDTSGGVANAIWFYRFATSSLSGTFTSTLAAAQAGNYECLRWTGHHASQAPEGTASSEQDNQAKDPVSHSVSWAAGEDNAWVAFVSQDDARSTNPVGISGWTDGFLNVQTGATDADGNMFALSSKAITSDAVDPGTFSSDRSDKGFCWTIAIRPGGVVNPTGTGALSLGPPTVSGTGVMHPSGTGDVTTPSPPSIAGSGTHTQNHTGTGALSLGPPSVSGSGVMHPSGVGDLTLPSPPSVSGSGEEVLTGTGDLTFPSPPVIAGVGEETISGTGAVTVSSPPSIAGVGVLHPDGSGSLVLGPPVISGSGEETLSGSGALDLGGPPAIAGSGSHFEGHVGTGDVTTPSLEVAGTGQHVINPTGSGAIVTPGLGIDGTGTHATGAHTGTGALVLPAPVIAGVGIMHPSGVGALTLPGIVIAGTGSVPTGGGGGGFRGLPPILDEEDEDAEETIAAWLAGDVFG